MTSLTLKELEELNRRLKELETIKGCAKLALKHWDEFGPEYGFDECMHWLRKVISMTDIRDR